MKKLFFTLSLIFALSMSATAQNEKVSTEALAKKELSILNEMVGLTQQQQTDLYRLYQYKYETLADATLSNERRAEFSRIADLKVEATLTGDQNQKLATRKKEYDQLRSALNSTK